MNTSRLREIIFSFVTGQGASQAIQIASGFLLVRYMDVHEYGIAAFMLAVQASAGMLIDVGLRDGVIAVIGQNAFENSRLGNLIGAAMRQRRMHLLPVATGIVATFVVFHFLQDLPLSVALMLAMLSIAAAGFNGWTLYFSLPLILRRDMKAYYKPQLLFQSARLALLVLCLAFNILDVVTLAIANVFAAGGAALWYRRGSVASMQIPQTPAPDDLRQLRRYILPLLPLSVFSAFQDQVTVFMLAIAGQTTNLAHAFAMGRLGVVFQFFGAATIVLAMPWLARTLDEALFKRYAAVVGSALFLAAVVVLGCFVFPDAYLWILGSQYKGLYVELRLAMGAASTMFLYSVLYYINNSRRWLWPWSGVSYVVAVIAIQTACVLFLDMSQTRNALLMSLLVGVAMMLLQMLHGILGFAFRTRKKSSFVEEG